jgi:hypothetical protein
MVQNSLVEFSEEVSDDLEFRMLTRRLSDAVVYSTDWTTETILLQIQKGNIDINPRFQRRDAWDIGKKSRFIESIIIGLPLPQIVLAELKEERGKYLVLDGRQRLLTLMQFTSKKSGKHNGFKLKGLDVRFDLIGKSFNEFETDINLIDDLNQFYNHPIRSVIIKNWPDRDFLHLIFVRLNTGSVQLSPQELRQALFPGPFADFIDDSASKSKALKVLLKNSEPDFRMRDVELLLRYLAFSYFIQEYSGEMKHFLDYTSHELSNQWSLMQSDIEERVSKFEDAISAGIKIFGEEYVGRKYTDTKFESRLNRSVLDVIAFYFSDDKIRNIALEHPDQVREAFKELCSDNGDFRKSIEFTTKSMTSTIDRFRLWGKKLGETLGLTYRLPELVENRIDFPGFWG